MLKESQSVRLPGGEEVPAIHLQGIGLVPAKPAKEIKTGDVLRWNNASIKHRDGYEVIAIESVGRTQIKVISRHLKDGKEYSQRLKADRLVGYFHY